jgi:competence protein ComEA
MSTTANERKALLFLSAVILAGSVVRVARAVGVEGVPAADSAALDGQLARVDAARAAKASSGKGRAGRKPARSPKGAVVRTSASAGVVYPPALPPGQRLARDSIVDVDRAGAAELERLPWIGPVLAQRIVDDRNRKGPFGSLEAFQRVRGVGPGLAERLRTRVTFSGAGRH